MPFKVRILNSPFDRDQSQLFSRSRKLRVRVTHTRMTWSAAQLSRSDVMSDIVSYFMQTPCNELYWKWIGYDSNTSSRTSLWQNILYTGSDDGCIKAWSLDLELVTTWQAHQWVVHDLAGDEDTDTLYSCSMDGEIKRWCVTSPAQPHALATAIQTVRSISDILSNAAIFSWLGKD